MAETQASWKDQKKEDAAEEQDQQEKQPRVSTIGKGKKAKIRKPFFQQMRETFIADDITKEDIREFVMKDVVVPAIQDAILDGINGALSMMFGITISRASRIAKSSSNSGSKVQYSGRFTTENTRKEARRIVQDNREAGIEYQMHDTEQKALDTMQELDDALRKYKRVSRADYYDCFGKETEFTDNNWGWTNLDGMRIQRVPKGFVDEDTGRYRNGYAVIMPKESPLD